MSQIYAPAANYGTGHYLSPGGGAVDFLGGSHGFQENRGRDHP